jgi:methionine aminopeptidase
MVACFIVSGIGPKIKSVSNPDLHVEPVKEYVHRKLKEGHRIYPGRRFSYGFTFATTVQPTISLLQRTRM